MAERHTPKRRYEVVLEALDSDVGPVARLRGFLKASLRAWRLKALSVRDVTPKLPPLPAAAEATKEERLDERVG
ncbi:MAG TPA: hypothetical protein VFB06_37670 [Streptosporangiaceae bacterium]|nr:hypothetical protein [Streptosporangiaceae bacterium]